jgi:hypothetical protein
MERKEGFEGRSRRAPIARPRRLDNMAQMDTPRGQWVYARFKAFLAELGGDDQEGAEERPSPVVRPTCPACKRPL